jgi:hypothetical protein
VLKLRLILLNLMLQVLLQEPELLPVQVLPQVQVLLQELQLLQVLKMLLSLQQQHHMLCHLR